MEYASPPLALKVNEFLIWGIANNIRLGNVTERPYESYFLRAIEIFETLNDPVSQSNLLYAKLILESHEIKRLEYSQKAIKLLKANLNKSDTLMMEALARHLNVAGLYMQGDQSIATFNEGSSITVELGDYQMQAFILNNMGYNFLIKEEYDLAIPYHLEALDISIQEGMGNLAANSANNLMVCYRSKGMVIEALDYFHCFYYIQSDINSDKYYQNLADLKFTHELDRVELKNILLETEQILQSKQRLVLIITSILLLLIAGLIFWSQRKISRANGKLRALDKIKARLFANISHELRTPITLINGPIQAIINGDHGKITRVLTNQLMVVRKNGRNLLNLVNEILDLTKLEAGKLQLVENPSHFYAFLNELIAAYQSDIEEKKINFHFDYDFEKNVSILIDEVKFAKIINNLLSNAFKFTPDFGNISLSVKKVGEQLSISVKDSGQGINPQDIEHVFERYYQSGVNTKPNGGTGIGLALTNELAKLHKGSISVTSELGIGSEFIFSFPLKESTAHAIEMANEEFNISKIKVSLDVTVEKYIDIFEIEKPVLLLTEDHSEMREFIATVLRPFFNVLEAANGIQALKILKDNTVDMIVSDVMMPKMDGFELLAKIKGDERLKSISMIMLTARAAEEDKLFALTLGVDDYLTKPFSSEELLVRAKNILENRMVRKLAQKEAPSEPINSSEEDTKIINDLTVLIEKHLDDNMLSVSFLAAEMDIGERQFLRKTKILTGFTPVQFIKEIRLLKAKSLLESHQVVTVNEASYKVGFDKVVYFSNQYAERFGKKPSASLRNS